MYKLYVFYAYAIIAKRRGYTLARAKKFFGKFYPKFKSIYDKMDKVYTEGVNVKGALTLAQWKKSIQLLDKELNAIDKEIDKILQAEPTADVEVEDCIGDDFKIKMRPAVIYTNWDEYVDSDFQETLHGYQIPTVQVRQKIKNWDLINIPGLQALGKVRSDEIKYEEGDYTYLGTKRAYKDISRYIGAYYKGRVVKKDTSEGIAGAILINLINL